MAELAISGALVLVELVIISLENVKVHRKKENDFQNDIKSMKIWLTSMEKFIHVNQGDLVEDHLEHVRNIAFRIEDLLDDFRLHTPPYLFHSHEISKKIHTIGHEIMSGYPLNEMSDRISAIKKSIKEHELLNQAFSFTRRVGTTTWDDSRISPFLLDHEMVGYETPKSELISVVEGGGKELLKLVVVGQSGSGKTALVKNVFSTRQIQAKFHNNHAWIEVGRNSDARSILSDLVEQLKIGNKDDPMDPDNQQKLRNYLTGIRYVIVLDNVHENIDLNCIKNAFPDNSMGSRIIVTTQSSKVATLNASTERHVFELNGLEWKQSWELFCRKAFPRSDGKCPSELEDCAQRIVTKCQGMPGHLVTLGRNVAHLNDPIEWNAFHDNLGSSETWNDSEVIRDYVNLSLNHKRCFLYLGMFPEDYSVHRGKLIRLWVAEGFATATTNKTAEDVADEYLNQLINKNLVLVSKRDIDGRPRSCRVHNLVLKFIVQKCEHENFASIFNQEHTSRSKNIRRLALHHDCPDLPHNDDLTTTRSMILFRLLGMTPSDFEKQLHKMPLLSILDFKSAPLTQFPEKITKHTLLKYLNLSGTKITSIPSSIKKLSYLETLDLKQTDVTELPEEISHLHNLHHLFAYKSTVSNYENFDSVHGVRILYSKKNTIEKLTNLQDLTCVKVGNRGTILKQLKNLRKLRKLGLLWLKTEHGGALCEAINMMSDLRTLDLCTISEDQYLELGEVNKPPKSLQRLYLKGQMRKIPDWISSLDNLSKVALKWTRLSCNPLMALHNLPNLKELQLVDCYTREVLTFESSGFTKLKVLLIDDLSELNMVKIEHGSMPELKNLSLRRCPKLHMVPLGMAELEQLEEVTLYHMPKLVTRISEGQEAIGKNTKVWCFYIDDKTGSFASFLLPSAFNEAASSSIFSS